MVDLAYPLTSCNKKSPSSNSHNSRSKKIRREMNCCQTQRRTNASCL